MPAIVVIVIIYSIRLISVLSNFDSPESSELHHSKRVDSQMSLNQGVKASAPSWNMALS